MFYLLVITINVILYIVMNCLFLSHERKKAGEFHTNYRKIKENWELQIHHQE